MKKIILFSIIATTFICCRLYAIGQVDTSLNRTVCDTITQHHFVELANAYKLLMDKNTELTVDKTIYLVKIYNSISNEQVYNKILTKDFINNFKYLFEHNYLKRSFDLLTCVYGRGMTIYSPKYDLYIGYAMRPSCKDIFFIKSK